MTYLENTVWFLLTYQTKHYEIYILQKCVYQIFVTGIRRYDAVYATTLRTSVFFYCWRVKIFKFFAVEQNPKKCSTAKIFRILKKILFFQQIWKGILRDLKPKTLWKWPFPSVFDDKNHKIFRLRRALILNSIKNISSYIIADYNQYEVINARRRRNFLGVFLPAAGEKKLGNYFGFFRFFSLFFSDFILGKIRSEGGGI